MDKHTFAVLEFDKVITFLKHFVTSPQGHKLCERLSPLTDLQEIKTLLTEVTEMKEILSIYDDIPIHGITDIERVVNRTRVEGFYLEPQQLQDVYSTITTARKMKTFFNGTASSYATLKVITDKILPLKDLEDAIRKAIGNHGEILDTASHQLRTIRQKIRRLRGEINQNLEELLNRENLQFIFQEQLITIRNGRFVLPVKIDHRAYLPGVVHDQSQSKATYFIEPLSVVDHNNELQILRKEEIHEEIMILLQLTSLVREKKAELIFNLSLLEKLDITYAKARLSKALPGCEPALNKDGHIHLNLCKHPILLARFETVSLPGTSEESPEKIERLFFDAPQIVPITIHMDKKISTLIVTGANAGGKTVTLKTLGLMSLMAQTGMHIPAAEGSTLPVFRSIFADIGDEQNIEESLSTFSAHMRRLDQIINEADDTSLVLIDELGAGTDPSEGAALGLAVLDYLRERNVSIALTTHMTLLKTYAYVHQDVKNVSVEFDPVTLKPTYKLVYGMPGLSNALTIAKNLGIADTILQNAQNYLEEKDKSTLDLIKGLELSQKEMAARQRELEHLRGKAVLHVNSAESLLKIIKEKKVHLLREYEKTFKEHLRATEDKLEEIIKEAQRHKKFLIAEAKKNLKAVKEEWNDRFPSPVVEIKPIEELKIGQRVKLAEFNQEGVVLKVDQEVKKAEILIGDIKIKTGFNTIQEIKDKKATTSSPVSSQPPQVKEHYIASLEEDNVSSHRVNLIGMRVDEALPLVDKAIDHALIRGSEHIEIIHGLGTGRLKEAIRKYLKEHSYVKYFGSDEQSPGGAGVTQVEIEFHPQNPSKKKKPLP
jgi:DNA mismatch repair protein MutS2